MSPSEPTECPVCGTSLLDRRHDYGNRAYFNCPRCSLFGLTRPAEFALDTLLTDPRKRAILSYGILKTPRRGADTLLLDLEACKRIVDAGVLPTPREQGDNLIRWLGANLAGPGVSVRIRSDRPSATAYRSSRCQRLSVTLMFEENPGSMKRWAKKLASPSCARLPTFFHETLSRVTERLWHFPSNRVFSDREALTPGL